MPTEPRKPLIVISYAHADEPEHPADGNSWRRQMATSANALWETLLQGRDMPEDKDEWRAGVGGGGSPSPRLQGEGGRAVRSG